MTEKKTTKKRTRKRKRTTKSVPKAKEKSRPLNGWKDIIGVLVGVVALSGASMAFLSTYFARTHEVSAIKTSIALDKINTISNLEKLKSSMDRSDSDLTFNLKFNEKEFEKKVELLEMADDHTQQKFEEIDEKLDVVQQDAKQTKENIIKLMIKMGVQPVKEE